MLFQADEFHYFNTDHITQIRIIQNRDPLSEPIRYSIYTIGQTNSVDVAGAYVAPFEAWLRTQVADAPTTAIPAKTDHSKSEKKVA